MNNSFLTQEEIAEIGLKSYGKNLLISRFAQLYQPENMVIGNNVRIDDFCILSGQITLENHIHISAYCAFYGNAGITIGDYSGTSPRCTIFSASDDFSGEFLIGPHLDANLRNVHNAPVKIGKFVQVGAGSTIMPGVTLEDGVAVGAMSLITRDLEGWWIYAGIPVKPVKPRSKRLLNLVP